MSYHPKTVNGYLLSEVVSALQKEIRRCNEWNALYWAREMERSGFVEYATKRLRIMASEDIGLVAAWLPAEVQALYELVMSNKGDTEAHYPLTLMVMMLARVPKDREVCDAACAIAEVPSAHLAKMIDRGAIDLSEFRQVATPNFTPRFIDAPSDYVRLAADYDPLPETDRSMMHPLVTAMLDGDEFAALQEASGLNAQGDWALAFTLVRLFAVKRIGLTTPTVHSTLRALQETARQLHAKGERGDNFLPLAQAVMLVCRSPRSDESMAMSDLFFRHNSVGRLEIPDYALDQHTSRGKSMGRGVEHFIQEASRLNNAENDPCNSYHSIWTQYWTTDIRQQLEQEDRPTFQHTLFESVPTDVTEDVLYGLM